MTITYLTEKAIKRAYESLPTTVSPKEFLEGHGNWGLDEKEYEIAQLLAKAYAVATTE